MAKARLMDTAEDFKKLGLNPNLVGVWEDGVRNTDDIGNNEVWYFDANFDDGSKVIIGFRPKTAQGMAQKGFQPNLNLDITRPGGKTTQEFAFVSSEDSSMSKDKCDVHFGPDWCTGNFKLQMLLRGQNILAYKNFSDDVVEYFVQKSIANGIDIIRIFDALNDVRNLETAIKACKKEGGHAQGTVSYTVSPVHDLEHFVKISRQLVEMGADSICIKDMAGLLLPYKAYELVKSLKEYIKVPIQIHTHYTSGIASMTYLKAIEAGADVVDCAISPMAMGTSQPPTEPLVASLKDTPYDTGYDLALLSEIAEYFRPIKEEYIKDNVVGDRVSARLSTALNTNIVVACGIHIDNLSTEKIEHILVLAEKLTEKIVEASSKSCCAI